MSNFLTRYFDSFIEDRKPTKADEFKVSRFMKAAGMPHNLVPLPKWKREYKAAMKKNRGKKREDRVRVPRFEGVFLTKKDILAGAILTYGKTKLEVLKWDDDLGGYPVVAVR